MIAHSMTTTILPMVWTSRFRPKSADYTAIVSGEVTWPGGNVESYIQPNPIQCREVSAERRR
jgi:hypothetical protein